MGKLNFDTDSLFERISFDENSRDWIFLFADSISFVVSGFWRLLEKGKIYFVSLDHGHQFGLPRPFDLERETSSLLHGKRLLRIKTEETTGDLTLILSDNIEIQVLIASAGYETYQFSIFGKLYIGLGGGDISIR